MSSGTKAKGSRRERQARKILEAAGYLCTKAGGSLGVFDLVAQKRGHPTLNIQVKSNRPPSPAERRAIVDSGVDDDGKEIWVFYDGRGYKVFRLRGGEWVDIDGTQMMRTRRRGDGR